MLDSLCAHVHACVWVHTHTFTPPGQVLQIPFWKLWGFWWQLHWCHKSIWGELTLKTLCLTIHEHGISPLLFNLLKYLPINRSCPSLKDLFFDIFYFTMLLISVFSLFLASIQEDSQRFLWFISSDIAKLLFKTTIYVFTWIGVQNHNICSIMTILFFLSISYTFYLFFLTSSAEIPT